MRVLIYPVLIYPVLYVSHTVYRIIFKVEIIKYTISLQSYLVVASTSYLIEIRVCYSDLHVTLLRVPY
jgi:hypothetical protein